MTRDRVALPSPNEMRGVIAWTSQSRDEGGVPRLSLRYAGRPGHDVMMVTIRAGVSDGWR